MRDVQVMRTCSMAAIAAMLALAPVQASAEEVIITITQVKALDKIDALSPADFMARVTIGGTATTTEAVRNQDNVKPSWVIKKTVTGGVHDVKVELMDKDVTKRDLIDINKVDKKRDLDFKINTKNCRVSGFSNGYRCKEAITRGGTEGKRAEITFNVDVTK